MKDCHSIHSSAVNKNAFRKKKKSLILSIHSSTFFSAPTLHCYTTRKHHTIGLVSHYKTCTRLYLMLHTQFHVTPTWTMFFFIFCKTPVKDTAHHHSWVLYAKIYTNFSWTERQKRILSLKIIMLLFIRQEL